MIREHPTVHATLQTIKAGKYEWGRLAATIMGVCFGIEAVAQMGEAIPVAARPFVAAAHEWSAFLGVFVSSVAFKLSRPIGVTQTSIVAERRDDGVEDTP